MQPLHCTPWCAIYSDLKNIKKCNKIQCKVHSYKVVKNAMQFMDNTKCIAVNCTELCSAVLILHWNVKIDRCTVHFTVHFSAFYSAIWCSFNIALKCELWSVHRVSSHAPNLPSGQCACHDDDLHHQYENDDYGLTAIYDDDGGDNDDGLADQRVMIRIIIMIIIFLMMIISITIHSDDDMMLFTSAS